LRCPSCGNRDTRVVDSRELEEAATIRRRRECPICGSRFTTYERTETPRLGVIKQDGSRQEFDRSRVLSGLQKSLAGRPVPRGAADQAADEIEAELRSRGVGDVDSSEIGELVLQQLARLDRLAYVRFATHFRDDLTDEDLVAMGRAPAGEREVSGDEA
jgi:transcriptional repressor NrdR